MIVYVDGNDLLECLAAAGDPIVAELEREQARENLARWLRRYCEVAEQKGVLVFDARRVDEVLPPTEHHGPLTVVNVPYGGQTMAEIAGPANRAAARERTAVVTADRRLADALARGRAKVVGPAEFAARVRSAIGGAESGLADEPHEKFAGLSEEEVDFWVHYFEEED
ncbi:MAG: NYN domain-containing protein [Planctomycetota bacterium]|jgi:predicted RNA-binding protein with PIN domain